MGGLVLASAFCNAKMLSCIILHYLAFRNATVALITYRTRLTRCMAKSKQTAVCRAVFFLRFAPFRKHNYSAHLRHAECAWAATAQKAQPFSTSAVREAHVGKSNLNIATYGLVLDSFWTRLDVLLLHALKAAARTLFYTFVLQHSVSF